MQKQHRAKTERACTAPRIDSTILSSHDDFSDDSVVASSGM